MSLRGAAWEKASGATWQSRRYAAQYAMPLSIGYEIAALRSQ